MKIELQYEELDGFIREGLYDAYETLYTNNFMDKKRVSQAHNLALVHHVIDDIQENEKRLKALEVLLQYFDHECDALIRMAKIKKKVVDEHRADKYRILLKTMRA